MRAMQQCTEDVMKIDGHEAGEGKQSYAFYPSKDFILSSSQHIFGGYNCYCNIKHEISKFDFAKRICSDKLTTFLIIEIIKNTHNWRIYLLQ